MDDITRVTYRQQVSFCGKPRCRKCRDGIGHGPYWYAYRLTPDGRKERIYIGRHLPTDTESTIQNNHQSEKTSPEKPSADQYSEINALDRLLSSDPTNETILQRLALSLAQAKRRGEALRACQRFFTTLQSARLAPSPQTRALYQAIQQGADLSPFIPIRRGGGGEDVTAGTLASPSSSEITGRRNQSPLVGRDKERETLRQLLQVTEQAFNGPGSAVLGPKKSAIALERPRPQCMALMGEPGIGKTRLAEEAAREALRNGWTVVWSHTYAQESGIPYRLWSELLRSLLEQGVWQPGEMLSEQQTLSQVYKPLKTLLPELHEWWPENEGQGVSSPYNHNPLSPEQEQVRLREAVYELLISISRTTPLLLVLDDIQWADGSSCELFGYLARRLSGHPIALLATCRETELPSNIVLHSLLSHMQREHAVEYVRVEALTDAQIAALVAHLSGSLVRHIQAQAAGNPFFAEELASSLHSGQDTPADETSRLPTSITAVLDQRMRRLSEPCQQLLDKAAVLGGSFGLPLIASMESITAALDEDSVLDLLEEAISSGVLTEQGMGTRITYRFWHPLLSSHLYDALSATRRARLHRRAAAVLQQTSSGRQDEQAAAITGHLIKGGAEASQIAYFAELAANYAYTLSAYPEAEGFYRIVIDYIDQLLQSNGGDQGKWNERPGPLQSHSSSNAGSSSVKSSLPFLLERLAECVRIQGKFQEARHLFERVLAVREAGERAYMVGAGLAPALENDALDPSDLYGIQEAEVQALLWGEIGWTWRYTGDNLKAWQCCERGEQVLRDAGITSGPANARLRFQQGSLRWQEGKYEEAYRIVFEALRLFQEIHPRIIVDAAHLTRIRRTLLGDPVDLGRAEALLGAIANTLGQRAEALRHMQTALAIYEQHDQQREIAHACCNMGFVHLKMTHFDQARTLLERSLALAERIGDAPLTSVVLHNLGDLAVSSGKGLVDGDGSEEAENYFRRSLALAKEINDREYLSLWHADLAAVLLERDKLDEAAVCVGQALRIARSMHNIPCLANALVALGKLRIAQSRTNRDPRCLQRARTTLQHALALPGIDSETRTGVQHTLAGLEQLYIPNF